MNLGKERRLIDDALSNYRAQLDSLTDEEFTTTPPMGGWSLAEVYEHIMKATLSSGIALERCAHKIAEPTKGGLNFWGYYTMLTGKFPPIKVTAPENTTGVNPTGKISIEEAKNLIIKTRKRMDTIAPLVKDASPKIKYKHPRLGMLTAPQWYKFIRVHLLHYLDQLDRIKNNFSSAR